MAHEGGALLMDPSILRRGWLGRVRTSSWMHFAFSGYRVTIITSKDELSILLIDFYPMPQFYKLQVARLRWY